MRFIPVALLGFSLMAAAPAFAQEMKPVRSITVSGLAERKVVPDEAHVTVNLNAQDKTLGSARSADDAKLATLMALVKKAGIDEKKVSTQSFTIQPVYTTRAVQVPPDEACIKDYQERLKKLVGAHGSGTLAPCPIVTEHKSVLEGYRVQTNVDITVGDTSKLAGVMDRIAGSGFEQGATNEWGDLMSVYYTLSAPDKVRDELLGAAIANAHAKAEGMARAAGASLGAVYQIQENGTPQFRPLMAPRAMMANAGAVADAAPMAPPAGEQQVQSNVTITYELK